jgi:apolipoprotein N-acyltransferase
MFVDIASFWWAVPFAVAGLPAAMAIYYGLAAIPMRRFGLDGLRGATGCALFWFLADEARGHLFTGFPWNLEGYAWSGVLPMLQITSVIGIYGLTLITLIAASLPVILLDNTRRSRAIVMISLLLLIGVDFWGTARLANASPEKVPNMRLRIVQPDIDQAHKWVPEEREGHLQRLVKLSAMRGEKPVNVIVWPESASPFYLTEDTMHREMVAAHLPPGGVLLTGVIRRLPDQSTRHFTYFNSLIAIDDKADVVVTYDKHHLVPYGEYIPSRDVLPIRALASLGLDFSSGPGPRSLHVKGLPSFSPLICYEAIFPDEAVYMEDRPGFLLNVTNDGWYGMTAGPYQHFASARVRAIEQGLPLLRAANTGISGVIDGYGHIAAKIDLGQSGFADAELPAALPPTIFAETGEKPVWLLFGIVLIFYGLLILFRKRN